MFDFITAGGFLMLPIILSSILAVVVIVNLFLTLQRKKVIPENASNMARKLALSGKMTEAHIEQVRQGSLLGEVLAAGLESVGSPRHLMKENIEETGRHVIHSMDKYMTTLGTIAAIAPLLGLLGTVVGMISVFSVITSQGVGNPTELAGGISQALITTAAGISVAVPALVFHRYFRGKINDYAVEMEKEAIKLVDAVSAPRKAAPIPTAGATPRPSMNPNAQKVRGGRVA
jgi:biopolymer transport protein ExbB